MSRRKPIPKSHPSRSDPKACAAASKVPLDLIPPVAEIQTAAALAHGATKYGPWNWRSTKINASAYLAAARRHLAAWFDGEDSDPESGQSHVAHAIAGLMIILDADAAGTLVDDRAKTGRAAKFLATWTKRSRRTPSAASKRHNSTH